MAPVLEWKQPTTKQTNPPPQAKTTDPKAAVLLAKGCCQMQKYAATNAGINQEREVVTDRVPSAGPKIFMTFDTSEKASKNERIVTCFNTEELMCVAHHPDDLFPPLCSALLSCS